VRVVNPTTRAPPFLPLPTRGTEIYSFLLPPTPSQPLRPESRGSVTTTYPEYERDARSLCTFLRRRWAKERAGINISLCSREHLIPSPRAHTPFPSFVLRGGFPRKLRKEFKFGIPRSCDDRVRGLYVISQSSAPAVAARRPLFLTLIRQSLNFYAFAG